MNDSLRYATVHVLDGDSAKLVDDIGADGTRRSENAGTTVTASILLTDRRMLETVLSMADLQARSPFPGSSNTTSTVGGANPVPRPPSPAQPVTYDPAPTVRMVQHGDTVRYIRGCVPREKPDTSVFVLFGADSVRRLSPARMFGRAMVASLLGQMQMTGVRQNIAARDAQLAQGLPRAPDLAQQCAR